MHSKYGIKKKLEDKCSEKSNCRILMNELKECEQRVSSRGLLTSENCLQELQDFFGCVDECVFLFSF